MKITYDPAVDAVYIEFHPLEPGRAAARPLTDEIIANYGPDGQLAGLEILDASRVLRSPEDAGRVIFEVVPLLTPHLGYNTPPPKETHICKSSQARPPLKSYHPAGRISWRNISPRISGAACGT